MRLNHIFTAVLIMMVVCLHYPASGTMDLDEPVLSNVSKPSDDTNIHFTGKYCSECHEKAPDRGKDAYLKYGGDYTQLCKCHGYTPGTYIHPVDIVPSEEKKAKIPKEFPLQDGRITCITCHDIYDQCLTDKGIENEKRMERFFFKSKAMFLRGDRFQRRTDLCFRCHDEDKYKMLDPHNQLTEEGIIIEEKCLYCHIEMPDPDKQGFKDIKLIGDLKVICQRCHGLMPRHPASEDHYIKPSLKAVIRLRKIEKQFGIILPLDEKGKMTCVTCHNPHDKGVIPFYMDASKGAGESFRHRLPGKLCKSCHGF